MIKDNKSNQWSPVCCRTEIKGILLIIVNIKYIDLTIKCIGFESFHYTINLNIASYFMVFTGFDFMFLSMYCYLESIKLFFSK